MTKRRRIEREVLRNLVNATEIARRAGVGRSAVANWATRHAGFPEPVVRLMYDWREVEAWLRATNRYPRPVAKGIHVAKPIPDRLSPRPWRP